MKKNPSSDNIQWLKNPTQIYLYTLTYIRISTSWMGSFVVTAAFEPSIMRDEKCVSPAAKCFTALQQTRINNHICFRFHSKGEANLYQSLQQTVDFWKSTATPAPLPPQKILKHMDNSHVSRAKWPDFSTFRFPIQNFASYLCAARRVPGCSAVEHEIRPRGSVSALL